MEAYTCVILGTYGPHAFVSSPSSDSCLHTDTVVLQACFMPATRVSVQAPPMSPHNTFPTKRCDLLRLHGQNPELTQELKNQMQHGVIVIFKPSSWTGTATQAKPQSDLMIFPSHALTSNRQVNSKGRAGDASEIIADTYNANRGRRF